MSEARSLKRAKEGDEELKVQTTDRQQAETTQSEQVALKQQQVHTPRRDDAFKVVSSDVSPHESDFDFLTINLASDFTIHTPSPHRRGFARSSLDREIPRPSIASPLSFCATKTASSPSRLFKSSLVSSVKSLGNSHQAVKTPDTRNSIRLKEATAKAWGKAPSATLATPFHAPSLLSEQQLLVGRQSTNALDCAEGDNCCASAGRVIECARRVETLASILDTDDFQGLPSGLLTSPSEHDSFFSFATSFSPLLPLDELNNPFLSAKLSPLVASSSYDLSRSSSLSSEQEQQVPFSIKSARDGIPLPPKTPNNRVKNPQDLLSAGRGGVFAPGSATGLASSKLFSDSFPNIQASTSATPGRDERSKLGGHSVMKMKLHASFAASPSLLGSHSTREIQAINNSLYVWLLVMLDNVGLSVYCVFGLNRKRKRYIRRRKAEERKLVSSNVQRKLLQTPVKTTKSPRTTRSPLQPWNGQTRDTYGFKTLTPRNPTSSQQGTAQLTPITARSLPIVRKVSLAVELNPPPTTTANVTKKRKLPQCVSMPSNRTAYNIRKSPLAAPQALALAITPAKQSRRKATTIASSRYTLLAPFARSQIDMFTFNSRLVQTPIPVEVSTALQLSLQAGSKTPLGSAVTMIPEQRPKKAPCHCKKSKCLKLYCECFASGGYCDASCNCLDCANTTLTEDVRQQAIASRLEKNPNAFKPKIGAAPAVTTAASANVCRRSVTEPVERRASPGVFLSPPGQESLQLLNGSIVAAKMHKHGCHCKKSACQKKYCECFQAGVPCGDNCRCIECKNQALITHANEGIAAVSNVASTPSNELEETYASPVLQGIRKKLQIDRETRKQHFSSLHDESSGGDQERTKLLHLRPLSSNRVSSSGDSIVRSRTTFTSPSTPQITSRGRPKRTRKISPIRGNGEIQCETCTGATHTLLLLTKRKAYNDKTSNVAGKAPLSPAVRSTSGSDRVFVLPLFGASLVPVESDVSAKIFGFLTNADLHNASLVSHLWHQVALGDTVWDHANFVPTEANAAQHSRKKTLIKTPMIKHEVSVVVGSNTSRHLVSIKREPHFNVLSALR